MANVGDNYQPNSHKSKEEKKERPKQTQVTEGTAIQRKKGLGSKIAETFTGDDSRTVGQFVVFDVILPAIKAMISDATSQGVERLLFGDSKRSGIGSGRSGGYTAYNRTSYPGRAVGNAVDGRRNLSDRARATHDTNEIILATRGEAEEVLERLQDLVANYDVASMNDLYDLVGITGSYTDEKHGWYDLRGAGIRRMRNGYLLDLPRTEPIE